MFWRFCLRIVFFAITINIPTFAQGDLLGSHNMLDSRNSLIIAPDTQIKTQTPKDVDSATPSQKQSQKQQKEQNKQLLEQQVIPQILPSPLSIPDPLTPDEAISPKTKLEFIISYKALSENGIITGEKYNISDPLVSKAQNIKVKYICSLDTPINDIITDDEVYAIKYILTHYQDKVLECLRKSGVQMRHDAQTQNLEYINDSTLLSIPAKRVLAYLENRYLIIEVLEEPK